MIARTKFTGLIAVPLLLASGCNSNEEAVVPEDLATATASPAMAGETVATANLQMADGTDAGTATILSQADSLVIAVNAKGLPPGDHGAHVHMTGKCEGPDFTSAGGHWNPADKKHGLEAPEGQHAGDMPNLVIGEDGTGTLEYALKGGTAEGVLDQDGSAMVIHAGKDDQKTDPSGDSGDRIACGVFNAG